MTITRSIFVGLDDIVSVVFACNKCSTKILLSPDQVGAIPSKCSCCDNPWDKSEPLDAGIISPLQNSGAGSLFQAFAEAIGRIRLLGSKQAGFTILLEFAEPHSSLDSRSEV